MDQFRKKKRKAYYKRQPGSLNHRIWVNLVSPFFGRLWSKMAWFKGSPDPSHFIFEINVGKSRIRQRTTLNLNNIIFN